MSKKTAKGIVHYCKDAWGGEVAYEIFPFDMTKHGGRAVVGTFEFEFEVPDEFNPVSQMVAALEEQKRQIRLRLAGELAHIDQQISKLTCLPNEVAA
jgi:hypothetical protein